MNICFKESMKSEHTSSYYVGIIIAIFTIFYYYFSLLTTNVTGSWTGIVAISLTFIVDFIILFQIRRLNVLAGREMKLLVLFLILLVVSYIWNSSGVHRSLMLFMVLSATYLFVKNPITVNESKYLFFIFTACVFFILINTAIGTEDAIKANKFNPNGGGFLLTLLFCASLVILLKQRTFWNKTFFLTICIISFCLQFVFISRTAMLGLILFEIAVFLFRAKKKTAKFKSAFYILLVLAVLGIVVAYIYSEVLYGMLGRGNIIIFGKDLFTGREIIWNFTFESIRENFWFGVGSSLNEEQFNSGYYELIMNAHNQPLGLLAASGVLVFVVFYVTLSLFVALLYKKNANQTFNRIPLIFMSVITIMSYFDIYFMALYNILPILLVFSIIVGTCRNTSKGDIKSL